MIDSDSICANKLERAKPGKLILHVAVWTHLRCLGFRVRNPVCTMLWPGAQ